MKRRGFFVAIGAALGAAKVAPVALKVEEIAVGGESPAVAPIDITQKAVYLAGPAFSEKQQEALDAMVEGSPARMVLFSGPRGCGRTFICKYAQSAEPTLMWAKSGYEVDEFQATRLPKTVVVRNSQDWRRRILGFHFERFVIDDAHFMDPEDLEWVRLAISRNKNAKVLLTGMPFGDGGKWLYHHFTQEGWNPGGCYHVHAKDINPHLLADYERLLAGQPAEERAKLINGDWV